MGDSFEKPKNNKSRVVERVQDDEDENDEQQESKESKEPKKSQKTHKYNTLTGIYYQPKLDDYEVQKIQELQGLARALSLVKRDFHDKVENSSVIHDYDTKDRIVSELNDVHDLHVRDKTKDVEKIDDIVKIKALDNCLTFFNDIFISQFQLLLRVPTFQKLIRDAVDDANDNEDDEEEEYKSIEKLTPNEVVEHRPVQIVPKFIGSEQPSSKKGAHFV